MSIESSVPAPLTPEQFAQIELQLGREPRGIVRIAAATEAGVPLVLQMRSLLDDVPFPTLYWLCSKDLHRAIGRIEGRGWVKQLEQRLQEDEVLAAAYAEDQRRYVASRWREMLNEDRARLEELGFLALFDSYGIGGIRHWDKVRCLHMQYAQHLVEGNCIGALMDECFELGQLAIER